MDTTFILPDHKKGGDHLSQLELKDIIDSGDINNSHLEACTECQAEFKEVLLDLSVLREINSSPFLQEIRVRISRFLDGLSVLGESHFLAAEPLPQMRGETAAGQFLHITHLCYCEEVFFRLKVQKSGAGLQISITPLQKIEKMTSFFLYNNSKLAESIGLRGRGTGIFSNIAPGQIEIRCGEKIILKLFLDEEG